MDINDSKIDYNENKKDSKDLSYTNFFVKIKTNIKRKYKKNFSHKKILVEETEEELNNNLKEKIKRPFWVHLFHTFLFSISYFFYFLSLYQCYDGEDICTMNTVWIATILITLIKFNFVLINSL